MTTIYEHSNLSKAEYPPKSTKKRQTATPNCKHPTKPEGYIGKDGRYVCTNTDGMKAWLKCAKKHGSCFGLTYHPGEKNTFWNDKKAEYEYSAQKWESANMIRSMFKIKDNVYKDCNDKVYDINNPYITNDKESKNIYFLEEGLLP